MRQIDTGHTSAHLTMVTDEWLTDLAVALRPRSRAGDVGRGPRGDRADRRHRSRSAGRLRFRVGTRYLHAPIGGDANGSERLFSGRGGRLATELGFDAEFVADMPCVVAAPASASAIRRDFHPRKYLAAIARSITDRGGMIFERSSADEFSDAPLSVKSNGHTITCERIVLATHTPLVGNAGLVGATMFQTKLAYYTSYVVGARVEKGRVPDALFWDIGRSVSLHSDRAAARARPRDLRRRGSQDGAGERHQRVLRFVSSVRSCRSSATPRSRTGGPGRSSKRPTVLPYIGETAANQFAGTGYSGNGLTFRHADRDDGGRSDRRRANPWTDLFEIPSRKIISGGAWDYVKENKDYPYYLIRDRVAGAEARTTRTVSAWLQVR